MSGATWWEEKETYEGVSQGMQPEAGVETEEATLAVEVEEALDGTSRNVRNALLHAIVEKRLASGGTGAEGRAETNAMRYSSSASDMRGQWAIERSPSKRENETYAA